MNEKSNGGSRRRGRWVALGLVISAIALILYLTPALREKFSTAAPKVATTPTVATVPTVTESVTTGAYFYRLKARYSYGDEPVEFDTVVGCSVRITRYRGGNTGFLASRYPDRKAHV